MLRAAMRALRSEAVLSAVAMLLFTFAAYSALSDRERAQTVRTTELAGEAVRSGLASEISLRVRPLERLAYNRTLRAETSREIWESEAALFLSAYNGYQSIEWLDPSLRVHWYATTAGDSSSDNHDYSGDTRAVALLAIARQTRSVRAGSTFPIPSGGCGFLVVTPVLRNADIVGYVVGTFRCNELLKPVLDRAVPEGYSASIMDGRSPVYQRPPNAMPRRDEFVAESDLGIYGTSWRVSVWQNPESLLAWRTSLPRIVLFSGIVISLLVALSVRLASAMHERSVALEALNRKLAAEVADRKRAAEALRQANEVLRAVIDSSPVAIIRMSADGAITGWNRAAERLLGWREPEVVGLALSEAAGLEVDQLRVDARTGQSVSGVECQARSKNCALTSAEVWIAPQHSESGRIIAFVCMIADTGARKQFEQQVRDSYKLDAVSRLAAGVAHNFNNLLAIITGYSHLVLEDMPEDNPLRTEIEEVLAAAERAAKLTIQLLAFGRGQPIRPEIVDLNRLVGDLREVLQQVAGTSCEILTPLGAEVGQVRIDPEQIEQALVALVVNARDAMPDGGRIVIETANIEVRAHTSREHLDVATGLYAVLSVSDSGPGMDEETRRHLFEPFFTTKGLGPSGLGLSSIYGIAKQNGGGVAVVSAPGEGTRIEVYLPRI